MDKELLKRYAISTLLTFFAGFAFVIVAGVDNFSVEGAKSGALIGLLLAATRAGLKVALESYLAFYASRKKWYYINSASKN